MTENPAGLAYATSYSFDAADRLTGVAQGSQTRTLQYDTLGQLALALGPETGPAGTGYEYDDSGNVIGKTDAGGVRTAMTMSTGC